MLLTTEKLLKLSGEHPDALVKVAARLSGIRVAGGAARADRGETRAARPCVAPIFGAIAVDCRATNCSISCSTSGSRSMSRSLNSNILILADSRHPFEPSKLYPERSHSRNGRLVSELIRCSHNLAADASLAALGRALADDTQAPHLVQEWLEQDRRVDRATGPE